MLKVLRYALPVVACLAVVSSTGVPAGGEGTAGSRARSVHTARVSR